VIASRQNDRLKRARSLARRRTRQQTGLFLVEGEDLVSAALARGIRPVDLFLRGSAALPASLAELAGQEARVEAELLDELATIQQGSSVLASFRSADLPYAMEPGSGVTLALAGISDPGNVGTLVRSAAAFAVAEVLLGPGCADPLGPRAVRASMGGIFAVPVRSVDDLVEALAGARVLALDGAGPVGLLDADLSPPVAIVVGAERAGVPEAVLDRADAVVAVPQEAVVESLNAASAGTIALWEAARRRSRFPSES
jgi:TrmH family RNA methyltransferase